MKINLQLLLDFIRQNQNLFISLTEYQEINTLSLDKIDNMNTPFDITTIGSLIFNTPIIPSATSSTIPATSSPTPAPAGAPATSSTTPATSSTSSTTPAPAPAPLSQLLIDLRDSFEKYNKPTNGIRDVAQRQITELGKLVAKLNIFLAPFFNTKHNNATLGNNTILLQNKSKLIDTIQAIQNPIIKNKSYIDFTEARIKSPLPSSNSLKYSVISEISNLENLCNDSESKLSGLSKKTNTMIVVFLKKLKTKLPKFRTELQEYKTQFDNIYKSSTLPIFQPIINQRYSDFASINLEIQKLLDQLSSTTTTPPTPPTTTPTPPTTTPPTTTTTPTTIKLSNNKNTTNDNLAYVATLDNTVLTQINEDFQKIKLSISKFNRDVDENIKFAESEKLKITGSI